MFKASNGMARVVSAACVILAAASVMGCGANDEQEELGRSASALGSTKPQVKITSLSQITDPEGNYLLTKNINMNGQSWIFHNFYGTFDGGNFTISNLNLTDPGDGAGFMHYLQDAIVKNVRFTGLTATSIHYAAGVATVAVDSLIENVAVEGTINCTGCIEAGGIVASAMGGTITRSYFKGTVSGAVEAGGIVGVSSLGFNTSMNTGRTEVTRTYAQGTGASGQLVTANDYGQGARAGGIIGHMYQGGRVQDVYAVGNVIGSGKVGGLVGFAECDGSNPWILDHGIYRGDTIDRYKPPTAGGQGGWAGTLGAFSTDCDYRWSRTYWDSSLDQTNPANSWNNGGAQRAGSSSQLRSPTTLNSGVYCELQDVVPGRCGDNGFTTEFWDAGSNQAHQFLKGLPGPNVQPN